MTPEARLIAAPGMILGYTRHSLHGSRMAHQTFGTSFEVVWYRLWLGGSRRLFRCVSRLFILPVYRGRPDCQQRHDRAQQQSLNPHL
jgi:hypothetical protein